MALRLECTPEILEAYRACERQLEAVQTPFIAAARRLEDTHRRHAYYAAYVSLRVLAPRTLPAPRGRATSLEGARREIRAWSDAARLCHQGRPDLARPDQVALADAMARFGLPMTPWLRIQQGLEEIAEEKMIADLHGLIERARLIGASQSWVFLRILLASPGVRRYRVPNDLDVEELSHDPGVFGFIVRRMIEVFSELNASGASVGLPEDLLDRHGLTGAQLGEMRGLVRAPRAFYELMNDLSHVAWRFYDSGVAKLAQAAASLIPGAVPQLDRILEGYKGALRAAQQQEFAPAALEALAGSRRGQAPADGG